MNLDEVARLAGSTEVLIGSHMERIARGYIEVTNAKDAAGAATALKELKLASNDLERVIREVLANWSCPPPTLILNVNKAAERKWTLDALSGLFANAHHYSNRFIYARTKENKIRDLSSLYYLLRDLAECADSVKSEAYRRSSLV